MTPEREIALREWNEKPVEERRRLIAANLENERARLNRQHGVIERRSEIDGWTLVALERHKPGVLRFTAERDTANGGRERRIGFAKDHVFDGFPIP